MSPLTDAKALELAAAVLRHLVGYRKIMALSQDVYRRDLRYIAAVLRRTAAGEPEVTRDCD